MEEDFLKIGGLVKQWNEKGNPYVHDKREEWKRICILLSADSLDNGLGRITWLNSSND